LTLGLPGHASQRADRPWTRGTEVPIAFALWVANRQ